MRGTITEYGCPDHFYLWSTSGIASETRRPMLTALQGHLTFHRQLAKTSALETKAWRPGLLVQPYCQALPFQTSSRFQHHGGDRERATHRIANNHNDHFHTQRPNMPLSPQTSAASLLAYPYNHVLVLKQLNAILARRSIRMGLMHVC